MTTSEAYTMRRAHSAKHREIITKLHTDAFMGGIDEVPDLSNGFWWLMWDGSTPVAFCGLEYCQYYQNSGYLARAAVAWDYRGNGLQKRLIRVRIAKARALGFKWLVTDTYATNHPSSNSLIRCGFKLFKPWSEWGSEGSLYWGHRL